MTDMQYVRLVRIIVNLESEFNKIEERDLLEIYNYLKEDHKNKPGLMISEYKFICWLNENDAAKYPIEINKPFIPDITPINAADFESEFCFNNHRSNLFQKLKEKLLEYNTHIKSSAMKILIGGSFTDANNMTPSDIDFIILAEESVVQYLDYILENDNSEEEEERLKYDCHCLIENFNFTSLKAYVWITMLGNLPEFKDKEYEFKRLVNNSFRRRPIYKLSISL